jgi:hypothetical protein
MRSASPLRPATSGARSESSPDSLQTPHAACCGAVGQTPEHQTPPRSHLRAAWTGARGESPAPAGGGGGRGAWDTYRDTTGTSTAVLWLHLSLSTSRRSSALTYMVQGSTHYHSHTWGTLTAQHSDGTQHSHRHHAHAHGTTQGERMGGESARCRRVTREGAWPAAAVAPPGASTPLDAP